MRFLLVFYALISSSCAALLQDAINKAAPFSTIRLHTAVYTGNIIINKPLTIIGLDDGVVIRGDGVGSVVRIKSSQVNLQNLIIEKSGVNMQGIDAAISMERVSKCKITYCILRDSLYGIDMNMVNDSVIAHNSISSKNFDLPLRGDGLKLYYANNNVIQSNKIEGVRDITLQYSNANKFEMNQFFSNRFATHVSLSKKNIFIKNRYKYNSVGIMLMGAKDTQVIQNSIKSSKGAAGIGVMIGAVSNFIFKKNIVSFNAKGIYIDGREKERGMKRYIIGNEISYNGEAMHFHASIKDNTIQKNKIFANIDDVVKDIDGQFDSSNIVEFNYWDRYIGFDENNDGIGDTPHKIYQYADQLWQYNNKVKFFYATPIMTLLNFLSRLAPFIEPKLIMVDTKPTYQSP
jgi:nitrous oxidase accessory protein